ncbi:MAG: hypothetical protein JWO42_1723 [Chloroflexi bacterium]|nr:hypothetical protein [Chloroflexota bacterium]
MSRRERIIFLKAVWSASISCLADGMLLLYSWRRQLFLPVSLATLVAVNFLVLQHHPESRPDADEQQSAHVAPIEQLVIIPIPLAHLPFHAVPLPLKNGQTAKATQIALANHIVPAHPLGPKLDSATPSL